MTGVDQTGMLASTRLFVFQLSDYQWDRHCEGLIEPERDVTWM